MPDAATGPRANRVARSLEAHGLLGVIFGGLIFILAVTGTLSVFNHEFQRWEQPDAPEMSEISPEAAEQAALAVFRSEETPTTHLYVNFPQEDLPRTVITTDTQAFFASADGSIGPREDFAWTQFLLDLHYYLHLPQILGLTVVGALGAMLLGLSFSGILSHPKIFRDAFAFRRGRGRLTKVDLHNRLSVWTLPFHFSNALTGAILGLASILAFAIAAAGFDNDTSRVFEPVFGSEPEINESAAPVAAIAKPLHYMASEYPDLNVTYFILHDPGTAGQHVSIIAEHPDRLIFGEYYNFDASGRFEGTVGIADGTMGQQITGAVYNVHFGNWGGLPVKAAYLVFGLALCTIVASGLSIYFSKRESKGRPAPKLEGAWCGLVWGTPAMLGITLAAALGTVEGAGLVATFWIGLGMVVMAGVRLRKARTAALGLVAMPVAVLAVLGLYFARYGFAAFSPAGGAITAVLITIVIAASIVARRTRSDRNSNDAPGHPNDPALAPAE